MQPRQALLSPDQFGKQEFVSLRSDVTSEDIAFAELQHRYCYLMRRKIKNRYGTVKNYCDLTGQNYHRMGQILRGSTIINGQDIGAAEVYLDLELTIRNNGVQRLAAHNDDKEAVGAFYTPSDVSEYMADRICRGKDLNILEPSFGSGSFVKAIQSVCGDGVQITACELDYAACEKAVAGGLLCDQDVYRGNFFDLPASASFDVVIGNPPYVRLRALDRDERRRLINLGSEILGNRLGEESSEWVPFLLQSTLHLKNGGSLALVLPYDFTYVKYARSVWRFLGEHFGHIEVMRSRQRIFNDILQDVILLFAFDKGSNTRHIEYKCYKTQSDLLQNRCSIERSILIKQITDGERVFQQALLDEELINALTEMELFKRAREEAEFHIGYVCGDKHYFHPSQEVASEYSLPENSLFPALNSSRGVGKIGLRTSELSSPNKLWLPNKSSLDDGERSYIKYGESIGINSGYKCRVRNPWWRVPGVKVPKVIVSTFGNIPRVLLNDGSFVASNSFLGAYLKDHIDPVEFCISWYTPLTLLSIEIEIHSLGGGVLIAVPRETGNVYKLVSSKANLSLEDEIGAHLRQGDVQGAYLAGASSLERYVGKDIIERLINAIYLMQDWRIH